MRDKFLVALAEQEMAFVRDFFYHVVFQNPGGQIIVILTNGGEARQIQLQREENFIIVDMPANSIGTLLLD